MIILSVFWQPISTDGGRARLSLYLDASFATACSQVSHDWWIAKKTRKLCLAFCKAGKLLTQLYTKRYIHVWGWLNAPERDLPSPWLFIRSRYHYWPDYLRNEWICQYCSIQLSSKRETGRFLGKYLAGVCLWLVGPVHVYHYRGGKKLGHDPAFFYGFFYFVASADPFKS